MNRIDAIARAEGFVRSHQLPWGADVLAIPAPDSADCWDVLVEQLEPVVVPSRRCDCGEMHTSRWPAHLELRVEPTGFTYLTYNRPPLVVESKDEPCDNPHAWVTRCCRDRASPGVLAVIAQIEAAFAGVPRGWVSLHGAQVRDDYGSRKQITAAASKDREACWQQVPAADLEQAPVLLSFLD